MGIGLIPKLPSMTVREVEAILERAGFVFIRQTVHRIWRHPDGRSVWFRRIEAISNPAHSEALWSKPK
jgi:hypothetical protein